MTTDYKDLFVPSSDIYLLNHSVGRPPANTAEVWSESFFAPWEHEGEGVWPCWLGAVSGFREALARLFNSSANNFCPQVNLSSALTKILQGMPMSDGRDTIVYTREDFPSIAFVLQQATRLGFRLRAISGGPECSEGAHWRAALDERTALVLVTHVQSNTGRQVPAAEITRLARDAGAVSVVDIAQSAGCVPIDLGAWAADFVIGSCVKWLCGGPGAGFLWVRPEIQQACEPLDVGWFSHEDPFEFDSENFRYAKNADRFWGGTPSVQPYVVAANGINTVCDIGVDTVRQHNLDLTQQLIEALPADNLVTPLERDHRGGTLVVRCQPGEIETVTQRLQAHKVLFDVRPTGIRLSPHIYNDVSEMETTAACLAR